MGYTIDDQLAIRQKDLFSYFKSIPRELSRQLGSIEAFEFIAGSQPLNEEQLISLLADTQRVEDGIKRIKDDNDNYKPRSTNLRYIRLPQDPTKAVQAVILKQLLEKGLANLYTVSERVALRERELKKIKQAARNN